MTSANLYERADPRVRHRERRGLFRVWIFVTGAVFALLLVATPLTDSLALPPAAVAVLVPAAEILLLLLSVAWLVRLVTKVRARAAGRSGQRQTARQGRDEGV